MAYEPDPGENDESAGLDTSTTPGEPPDDLAPVGGQQPDYMNPPEGNPIQSGVQAAEQGIGNALGPQGPIPNTGDPGAAPPNDSPAKIASYLMGAGAAAPEEASKVVAQIKQQGVSDDDANLLAVAGSGDVGAQWAMLQYQRMAFNAKQAFARTALNGTEGKPADIKAATEAATQASAHVPDGSSVSFHADRLGVTATVLLPGTSQRQTFEMTPQQFDQYLDLSKTSQWDRLMEEGGIPVALTKVGAKPLRGGADQNGANQSDTSGDGEEKDDTPAMSAFGERADQRAPDGSRPWIPYRTGRYSNGLENEALKMFPSIGENQKRNDWMAAQSDKEAERKAKVDAATEGGKVKREVAGIQAGAKVQSADITAKGKVEASANRTAFLRDDLARKLKQMELGHQDAQQRTATHLANARLLNNPGMGADEIEKLYQQVGVKIPQGDTPTSVTTGKAPVLIQSPAEARNLAPGTVYTTPDGRKFTR